MKMILDIDPFKSLIVSISSLLTGTLATKISLMEANTALQHTAWVVAILAGLVSFINGIIIICEKYQKFKNRHKKPNINELE